MSHALSTPRRRTLRATLAAATLALGLAVALPALAAEHPVAVSDNNYTPDEITIAAGDTVNWTYAGSVSHDVVLEDGSFDSSDFATDGSPDTISLTFEDPGTYLYYCTYHAACEDGECFGEMWGSVTVEGAAAEPAETESSTPEPSETAEPTEAAAENNDATDDLPNTGSTPVVAGLVLTGIGALLLRRRDAAA